MNKLVYVIAGKDDSLVSSRCEQLLDSLIEQSQKATGLFNADPDSNSITEVLDELRTAPFLTDKRIVTVKKADEFVTKYRDLLEPYFDNPCPTGILILTVGSWKSNTKLAKKLQSIGELISVEAPRRGELPQQLASYANDAYSKKISRSAAELLIEITGDELPRLYCEIDKLAMFADKEKAITEKHIESLIGHNRLFNAFSVIDSIIAGNAPEAVERLRGMFADDKSAEYTVVGAFAFHFRRMFTAKAMTNKGDSIGLIIKKLQIWSNKDRFFDQLKQIPLKQIGKYLQRLAETDYAIKTGRTQAPVAMEQMVLSLAAK
ncbi:MAG: DNA polymerase III subunit delta [Sedimentisphaerales bacterium]|nr:DNA polymerase III subunit delta [Sedimentisphaerales bacterium]